ncbi:MAG TPA: acyl carrier protein [Candidatus Dormibacteraeota bacterium]|nr:acyl carrier protein [Candidatus Dormibacteraeota bacterium]
MDDEQIRTATRAIVAEVLELDQSDLRDDASFSEFGANSVQQMEIVVELSARFGVRYSMREEAMVTSVDHAVTITRAHIT